MMIFSSVTRRKRSSAQCALISGPAWAPNVALQGGNKVFIGIEVEFVDGIVGAIGMFRQHDVDPVLANLGKLLARFGDVLP